MNCSLLPNILRNTKNYNLWFYFKIRIFYKNFYHKVIILFTYERRHGEFPGRFHRPNVRDEDDELAKIHGIGQTADEHQRLPTKKL